jgi:NitT/TauT family transport system permease protein
LVVKTIIVRAAVYLLVPCLFLASWAFTARHLDNEVILPGIGQVAELFTQPTESLIAMGSLVRNVAISLVRVLAGYLLAVCLAVPLGILMGYYGTVFRLLNGFVALFGLYRRSPGCPLSLPGSGDEPGNAL